MDEDDSDLKTFYICDICNQIFNNRESLNVHHTQVHSIKTFKCAVCQTYFDSHEQLLEHMSIHCSAFSFKCQNCGKTFTSFKDLKMHMDDHIISKNFNCNICNKNFGTLDVFHLHMETAHKINNSLSQFQSDNGSADSMVFVCEKCPLKFENESDYSSHVQSHKQNGGVEGVLQLENNLGFTISKVTSIKPKSSEGHQSKPLVDNDTSKILQKSLISDFKDQNDTFTCKLCNKKFAFKETLDLHLKTHPSTRNLEVGTKIDDDGRAFKIDNFVSLFKNENDVYSCIVCKKTFVFGENLELHMETHSEVKSTNRNNIFQCDICGKFTYNKIEFDMHKETHPVFNWEKYNNVFSDKAQLENHCKSSHTDSDLTCNICKEKFAKPESLELHQKIRHEKKNLMCGVCGDVFSKRELKNHMKQHQNNKNKVTKEKCYICDEMVDKSKLFLHMETHESEFYYCEICDDEFDDAETYQDHFDTHFKCSYCSELFKLKEQLDKHLMSHYHHCDICQAQFDSLDKLKSHELEHDTQVVNSVMEYIDEEERQKDETIEPEEELKVLTVPSSMVHNTLLSNSNETSELVDDNSTSSVSANVKSETCITEEAKSEVSEIDEGTSDPCTSKTIKSGISAPVKCEDNPVDGEDGVKNDIISDEPALKKQKTNCGGRFSKFKKNINCEYCNRRFRSAFVYRDHLKNHTNKCSTCSKIFRKGKDLWKHKEIHFENEDFTCIDCGENIVGRSEYKAHQLLHKKGNRHLSCNICDEQFLLHQVRELEKHGLKHRKDQKIPEYQVLDLTQMGEGVDYVKCYICHKTFINNTVLVYHMNTVHEPIVKPPKIQHKCDVCLVLFATLADLWKHSRIHFKKETYKCMYKDCKESFFSKEQLREHVKTHIIRK